MTRGSNNSPYESRSKEVDQMGLIIGCILIAVGLGFVASWIKG